MPKRYRSYEVDLRVRVEVVSSVSTLDQEAFEAAAEEAVENALGGGLTDSEGKAVNVIEVTVTGSDPNEDDVAEDEDIDEDE